MILPITDFRKCDGAGGLEFVNPRVQQIIPDNFSPAVISIRAPPHQENPSFTFPCFSVLFRAFLQKSRKSKKKQSPLLFLCLANCQKKVDYLRKVHFQTGK